MPCPVLNSVHLAKPGANCPQSANYHKQRCKSSTLCNFCCILLCIYYKICMQIFSILVRICKNHLNEVPYMEFAMTAPLADQSAQSKRPIRALQFKGIGCLCSRVAQRILLRLVASYYAKFHAKSLGFTANFNCN